MGFWVYVQDLDTGTRLNIHTDDCDFIMAHNERTALFMIGDKRYIEVNGLENFAEDLEKDLFVQTDSSCLVNFNKVKEFDEIKLELGFGNSERKASVARIQMKTAKIFLENKKPK